jgi:23S rRNA (cytidine1920-2'-O)/16S rRNA (cytidine1409-2'-O)-methyltransferase
MKNHAESGCAPLSKPIKKQRAWERLIAEGWVQNRADAERWILLGSVTAGGAPVTSAGQLLPIGAALAVRGIDRRYVGKGGHKLEGALDAFGLDVTGRVAIDAGASTGGFVDCLLQRGCARLYAVDVGYGQLHGTLRNHPAVVNLERTNIGDPALLTLDPPPTLGTVDLSYLSLRKATPIFADILRHRGDLVCLVKPLFEIEDARARREGVVPPETYAPMLASLCAALSAGGAIVRGLTHSPITGNAGTLEFFLWLGLDAGATPCPDLEERIATAVRAGLALEKYKKA